MPAFRDSLTDGQVAELVSYLRRQFAPDKPAWTDVDATPSGVSGSKSPAELPCRRQNPLVGPLPAR